MADERDIERALVITAHPDDVDFGAAGTVATWTDAGIDVAYCIVTDGDAGGHDRSVSRQEMRETRHAEQTAAAKHVGVSELHWLGYPDGRLESTLDLRRDISRVIREVRPQRVVCPSPIRNFERIYASHPDHLAAGEASICAVYPDARNPFAHPELLVDGLEPWTVDEVWVMATATSNVYVDTTDVIDRKLEALLSHVSQHQDPSMLDGLIRDWGAMVAQAAGYPQGHYAEGFQRVATT
ncbi:MAG: PIG-L family deacetylase [Acidimicrobiia bacterium]|nr:PIG-L family deacetylase [Acidimicrobiia bacterium]